MKRRDFINISLKGSIVNFVIRKIRKMVPSYSLPGSISLKNILKENSGKKGTSVSINNNDTAFLQYTGGTTGVSKGAELTHGNICANVYKWNLGLEKI